MSRVLFGARRSGRSARAAGSCTAIVIVTIAQAVAVGAHADEVAVAVAANFLLAARALEPEFEAGTGHDLVLISGSTGYLYAQIRNGAPFDILLAADSERPRILAAEGYGAAESIFTYAIGRLVLWSGDPARVQPGSLEGLDHDDFRFIAIASPDLAPYGLAAREALARLGVWESIQGRIVTGQNVAQAFSMAETGSADLGLVALSQAEAYEGSASFEIVPETLHEPIRQDAILLRQGAGNQAASDFMTFLQSAPARLVIGRRGYRTPQSD